MLRLREFLAPGADVVTRVVLHRVHSSLSRGSDEQRLHAIELVENLTPTDIRASVHELLDVRPAAQATSEDRQLRAIGDCLHGDSGSWTIAAALYAVPGLPSNPFEADIQALLGHSSPVVRETALSTLGQLGTAGIRAEACSRLATDSDPDVRCLAESMRHSAS